MAAALAAAAIAKKTVVIAIRLLKVSYVPI